MTVIKRLKDLEELEYLFYNIKTIDVLGEDFLIEKIEIFNEKVKVKLVQTRKLY